MLCLSVFLLPLWSGSLFAQATGTISGRVSDTGGAVIPGATVVVTAEVTNFTRTTTTNEDGFYSFAALQPGNYNLKADMRGFAQKERTGAVLTAGATLSLDFTLAVAGAVQEVDVIAEAAQVDTAQSVVAGFIATSEVQNLPILNRTFSGLVTLTPQARVAPILNSTKLTFGAGISVGGAQGRNVMTLVDGSENRDDIVGGPMMNFTIEGIQEFKLLAHSFSAAYGRGNNGVVEVVTKSGTNQLHGTVFAFGRNDSLTAIEYFNKKGNLPKSPYDREQIGGSLGGPIKKDRWFIFGATERTNQTYTQTFPATPYNEALIAQNALPNLLMHASQFIPQPFHDFLMTVKSDYRINDHHSLFLRYAQQNQYAYDDQFTTATATQAPHADVDPRTSFELNGSILWSAVGSWTWLIGNKSVNTFTVQRSYYDTSQTMPTDVPSSQWPLQNLTFPSVELGRTSASTDQEFFEQRWQFKDDFARLVGRHSLKVGGDFAFFPEMGMGILLGATTGRMTFFDNPSVIVSNSNGRYPLGFQTPGIVSAVSQGTDVACGCSAGGNPWRPGGPGDARIVGMKDYSAYFQDDWKFKPRLTLNLGIRYDLSLNQFDQSEVGNNRAYLALKAIAPIEPRAAFWSSGIPKTPAKNFSPRIGLAWDPKGDGKTVIRLGGGLYWDKFLMESGFMSYLISKPILDLAQTYVNTNVGVGQLANYVYNVSPLPPNVPPVSTQLPFNANIAATIVPPFTTNPYNTQEHVGFTRAITPNTTISSDYTHILGIHETRRYLINPIEGAWDPTDADQHIPWGQRRFAPAFNAVFGQPNILGAITEYGTGNLSKFNELATQVVHHAKAITLQASYTLMNARAYGGIISGALGGQQAPLAAGNPDVPYAPVEWAPAAIDERHRVVVSGVIELPKGFQLSPVFQAASARPYTATQGQDLNGDGSNTDLWVNPNLPGNPSAVCGCSLSSGQVVGPMSQRGTPIINFDTRVTKTIKFTESLKLGLFAEFYNITNRANFGAYYVGNSRASNFRQPFAFQVGLPTSRQLQLGGRFSF